jgi:MYXO-CTERM domain-containing protein
MKVTATPSFTSVLALCASLLLPSAATAASLTIDNLNPDDTVVFSFSGFDVYPTKFSINGNNYGGAGTVTVAESNIVTFLGAWNTSSGITPGSRTIFLVDDLGTGAISDLLHYTWYTSGFNGGGAVNILSGYFKSDNSSIDLGFLTGGENPLDVFVKGSPVTFGLPNLGGTILTDAPASVPEGGPGVLGLLGVTCLLAWRRRQLAA